MKINYSIDKILLIEPPRVNETLNVDLSSREGLTYDLSGQTILNDESNTIEVTLAYSFFKHDTELFSFTVQNHFKLHETKENAEKAFQDQSFSEHLITISLHHARGVQSMILKESKYKEFYIPLEPDIKH